MKALAKETSRTAMPFGTVSVGVKGLGVNTLHPPGWAVPGQAGTLQLEALLPSDTPNSWVIRSSLKRRFLHKEVHHPVHLNVKAYIAVN